MVPTLLVGDFVFVSKYSYGYSRYSFPFGVVPIPDRFPKGEPARGDVAVFRLPSNPSENYIKRLVGVPGDRIQVKAGILHVNGDDPEAVTFACKMAIEFRQTFHRDIVIDMWCYRRFGHNEGDEPSFTQPLMYKNIKTHPGVSEIYSKRLVEQGLLGRLTGRIDHEIRTGFAEGARGLVNQVAHVRAHAKVHRASRRCMVRVFGVGRQGAAPSRAKDAAKCSAAILGASERLQRRSWKR
jgi:signal peptidase I